MDVNEENKYLKNLNNLLKGLKSPDSFTVANAIRQIGEMGNKIPVNVQKDVIKQILELTAGKDHTIQLYATMALGSLKNSTPIDMQAHVAQRLLELSKDTEWGVRGHAVISLGKLKYNIPYSFRLKVIKRVFKPTRDEKDQVRGLRQSPLEV